jgi:DnaJ-class molecular chaperone
MDHYNTLGVAKTATPDEIKKAYRKLASQHHPDKGGDTAKFQEIQTAYDTLSDPNKRQQYDNPNPFGGGHPGGFHFSQTPGGFNFNGDFNDLFNMFHQQHARQQRRPDPVFRTTLGIQLEDAYFGNEQTVKLQTHNNTHAATIKVPKGVENGMQVKIDNMIDGASLIVEFRIIPHLKYERHGNELVCNHPISVLDLITGTTFEFTTLSGKTLEVTVKPKTQPYMQLKLAGQGMPIYGTSMYGDQIIMLKPFIPDTIDEQIVNSILQSQNKGN